MGEDAAYLVRLGAAHRAELEQRRKKSDQVGGLRLHSPPKGQSGTQGTLGSWSFCQQ